mmetsp:Transcript_497/g.1082  ORF Transcript_497/g.1082 Transcript_497/m.1082 type:complete len:458 (-) Transcript_497:310-1683(-)
MPPEVPLHLLDGGPRLAQRERRFGTHGVEPQRGLDRRQPLVAPFVRHHRRDHLGHVAPLRIALLRLAILLLRILVVLDHELVAVVEVGGGAHLADALGVARAEDNLLLQRCDLPRHLGQLGELVARLLEERPHLDDVLLLPRQERQLNVLGFAVLLEKLLAPVVHGQPDRPEVDVPPAHDVRAQRVLVLVAHAFDVVPVDERVEQPVPHHHQERVAPRHHLVELLVLDALVVLGAALGERVRRRLDLVELRQLDGIVSDLVGVKLDGLLAEDLLDRLHIGVRREPQRQVVVRHRGLRVRHRAEDLEVRLREHLEVCREVPCHEADREEGEAHDQDPHHQVQVLGGLHPEAALQLRDGLQEQEPQEQVVDPLEGPGEAQPDDHEDVHRGVAPRRLPQRQAVPEGALVAVRQPVAEHGADERREEEVEEGARLGLEKVARGQESDDTEHLEPDSLSPAQ